MTISLCSACILCMYLTFEVCIFAYAGQFVTLPWLLVLSLTAQITVTTRSFVKGVGGVAAVRLN